jgi:hypothetical protein
MRQPDAIAVILEKFHKFTFYLDVPTSVTEPESEQHYFVVPRPQCDAATALRLRMRCSTQVNFNGSNFLQCLKFSVNFFTTLFHDCVIMIIGSFTQL